MTTTSSRRGIGLPPSDSPPAGFGGVGPTGERGVGRVPLILAGAAVLILVAVWIVAFSPALGVRTVTVTGTKPITSTQTLTADEVRTAAKISSGSPLIRLDTGAIRSRVEALPDVASAAVSLAYPSTVRIEVTERVAVGYLANSQAGGSPFELVDGTGAQYRDIAAAPANLPRFALPSGAAAQSTGHDVSVVAAALSASVLSQLAEISADSSLSITLILRDGRMVTWGSADNSPQKAALLPSLLAQPGTRFDVSNPNLVVAR